MAFIKKYRIPLILALIKFILPYLLQDSFYELHRDEYSYLAEAGHLDWGFMEVPPLLSLLSKITHLLGNGFFWVKFWPSLFGALTVLIICEMIIEMGGRVFAQCVACICMIAGVYLRIHFLFQPNFLEIFWWSLHALLLIKYINSNNSNYILLSGIAAGLAWLSKYSIIFFVTGIIAGIILTPDRKILFKKYICMAAGIALIIALPNIIWQYNHKWPVIYHMKELRETQLRFVLPLAFLKDQVLMHLPYCFIWIGGLIWLLFIRAGKRYRILAWIYITVITLLIISSGKNYYSLGAYPMLLAAGGVWLESITVDRFRWLRYAAVSIVIILAVPFVPMLLPIWKPVKLAGYYTKYGISNTGILKWEDRKDHPLPQDFADMLGWKELADKVSNAYALLPDSIKKITLIHCRNYGQAGAISYYGNNLPQVNTDNGSFLLWMPDTYHIKNILLVARRLPDQDDSVFQQFEKHRMTDSIKNFYSREFGTKIFLFENANNIANSMIEENIRKQKNKFRRWY